MITTTTMGSAASGFGPYRGQFEGHARVYMSLALVEAAALVVLPWLIGGVALLRHQGYFHDLPVAPGWLALIDLCGIVLAYAWYSLYRSLSAKIAAGAPGFAFLDRVRLRLALLAQIMVILMILAAAAAY